MKRSDLEKKILEQYPELKLTNLKNLNKQHLEGWVNNNEVIIAPTILVKIFTERNQRAEINQRLNNDNFSLKAKLNSLTNWSKSEVIQGFKKLFGVVTKTDDLLLGEIGAVSKESAREDLDKAEEVVDDLINIAQQYRNKYGDLDKDNHDSKDAI